MAAPHANHQNRCRNFISIVNTTWSELAEQTIVHISVITMVLFRI